MKKEQYIVTWDSESYTYPSLIYPIIEKIENFRIEKGILKEELKIWLPFDIEKDMEYTNTFWKIIYLKESLYYKILKEAWYNIIASHIATGQDFFKYEPERFDLIISNPPFKWKSEFFKRALELWKPFALVCPASWMNDWWPFNLFSEKKIQLFMSDKRSKFFNDKWESIGNQPSFKAIYYCHNFLIWNDIQWFKLNKFLDK